MDITSAINCANCGCFAPLAYPKSFIMDYEMIKYTHIHRLNNRFSRGRIIVKVKYEVSHISKIELLQNPMEKLLGLGHLRFVGYTYHEAKKHMDRIEPWSFIAFTVWS